jgi:hypothetical protein
MALLSGTQAKLSIANGYIKLEYASYNDNI